MKMEKLKGPPEAGQINEDNNTLATLEPIGSSFKSRKTQWRLIAGKGPKELTAEAWFPNIHRRTKEGKYYYVSPENCLREVQKEWEMSRQDSERVMREVIGETEYKQVINSLLRYQQALLRRGIGIIEAQPEHPRNNEIETALQVITQKIHRYESMLNGSKRITVEMIQQAKRYPIERMVKAERRGGKLWAQCVFHKERTPSMVINTDYSWHCFGCGKHGDSIDFVRQLKGLGFGEAVMYLQS